MKKCYPIHLSRQVLLFCLFALINLFIVIWIFSFISCGKDDSIIDDTPIPPTAEFTAVGASPDGITVECGECVNFRNKSSGDVEAWFWDFDGGIPSTWEFPDAIICYDIPGKFDVSLSINIGEDKITKTEYVEVLPKELIASFSAEMVEIIQSQTIMLKDESTGSPDSWSWVVEGPGPIQTSQDQNPSFMLEDPGVYTVSLTIKRGDDQEIEEKIGYITVLAYSDFNCFITNSESNNGLSTKYTYNELDQLTRSDLFINGVPGGFNTYSWTNDDFLELVENFDASQVKIGIEAYTYNDQGILNTQEFFNGEGNSLSKYTFTIVDGLITGGTKDQDIGEFGIFTSGLKYIYDENFNNVIEEQTFSIEDGTVLSKIKYEFDDGIAPFSDMEIEQFPIRSNQNNPTRTTYFDGADNIIIDRTSEYGYNEHGRANSEKRTTIGNVVTELNWDFYCVRKP